MSGDPSLTRAQLKKLLSTLAQHGVQRIRGHFYIDISRFDHRFYGPGWMWDEVDDCYAAPVSAGIIDHNCFRLWLSPTKHLHRLAHIHLPSYLHIQLYNRVTTERDKHNDDCTLSFDTSDRSHYRLSGCVQKGQLPEPLDVAVKSLQPYLSETVSALLREIGIHLQGRMQFILDTFPQRDNTPSKQILASVSSPPLSTLIHTVLKKSDNLYANSLCMAIAYKYLTRPAHWHDCAQRIKQSLPAPYNTDEAIAIVDGAGVSRYNLLSAEAIGQLLLSIQRKPKLYAFIWEALPIPGIDGTLEDRPQKNYRAKTGSMRDMDNLAGYLTADNQHHYAFVILTKSAPHYRKQRLALQQQFLDALSHAQ